MSAAVWEPGRNAVHKLIQLCDVMAIALNRFYQLSFRLPEESASRYMAERQQLRDDLSAVQRAIFPRADIAPQHTAFRLATAAVAELARNGLNESPVGDAQEWLAAVGWALPTPYPKAIQSPLHQKFDEERRFEARYGDIRNRLFAALAWSGQTIPDHIHQRLAVMVNPWSVRQPDPISQADLLAMVRETEPAPKQLVPSITPESATPRTALTAAERTQLRLKCYPPVPLEELRPRRPEPADSEVSSAMRIVPVALSESRFGGPAAHLAASECEHMLDLPAWLAFAQQLGLGRPAAEWAIYRLVEAGRLCVVWPEVEKTAPITTERAIERAERYRGRVATVTDWDLFEHGRVLHIRSTPALWEWWREKDGAPGSTEKCGEQSLASEAAAPPPYPVARLNLPLGRHRLVGIRRTVLGAPTEAGRPNTAIPSTSAPPPPQPQGAPPPAPQPAPAPKRSTTRGEGRTKLVAALTKHHHYAEGGALNQNPIGNNELARLAAVEPSTASEFFKREFGRHAKYKALCLRDPSGLTLVLKNLNGELHGHELLYGRRPADEDDRDSER